MRIVPKRRVVVFHDLNPMFFSFRPLATLALGERLVIFDGGMERRPAPADALAGFMAEQLPRVEAISARYARPATGLAETANFRSVVALSHPILRMLQRIEATWTRLTDIHSPTLPRDADVTTIVTRGLATPLQRFPYTNFHTALLSGDVHNKSRASAAGLAAALAGHAGIAIVHFPELLAATLQHELETAGIHSGDASARTAAPQSGLLESLRHWQARIPEETWAQLVRLNAADLVFFDEAAAHMIRNLAAVSQKDVREVVEAAAALTGHRGEQRPARRAAADPNQPKTLIEPDPVLGWRLMADRAVTLTVVNEPVVMASNADGCRPVPGQPAQGRRTLAAYGCSCTFGWAVPLEHTFCAILQARHPDWRVENHGVNGYGQGQNLLQLMRDLRWNDCDLVTFCWIAPHLTRNVADVIQVQKQTEQAGAGKTAIIRFMPRACLDANGEIQFREVAYSRPELLNVDLSDFTPDPHYLDLVCFGLLKQAAALVTRRGGHFFVTVLLDQLSAGLARLLEQGGIPVVDASVAGAEYVNPFELSHPNARANRVYADRIDAYVTQRNAEGAA